MFLREMTLICLIQVISLSGSAEAAESKKWCIKSIVRSLVSSGREGVASLDEAAFYVKDDKDHWQRLADKPISEHSVVAGGAYAPTTQSFDTEGDHFQIRLLTTSHQVAGQITYSIKGSELKVDLIQVDEAFQGQGLGTALYAKMLADNPSAKRITALLELSNKDAYEKAISEGKNKEDAIKSTPSYFICSKLGFKRVVWNGVFERNGSRVLKSNGLLNIYLTVER